MEKKIIFGIFIIFFSISFVSALDIQLSKQTFDQGETFFATLEGNILEPINKEDVGFFIENVQKPFDYDITRINNIYYIYAILPYTEEDYILKIEDVYFKEQNQFLTEDLQTTFSITNRTADFYIDPGFIIATDNFTIDLYNNLDFMIPVTYELELIVETIDLPSQTTTKVFFDTSNFKNTILTSLIINSENTQYNIPTQIIKGSFGDDPGNIIILEGGPRLQFSITNLDEILKIGESYKHEIEIRNLGDESTNEVILSVSEEISDFIVFEDVIIENILPKEEITVRFIIEPLTLGVFQGSIFAESEFSSDIIEVLLEFGEDIIPITSIREELTCSELGGVVCSSDRTCDVSNTPSSDHTFCCTGTCEEFKTIEESNSNTTIVVIVSVLLLIILVFIGFRMKKAKQRGDPLSKRVKKISKT